MKQQTLNLKDIHLPEPVSWWPPAPGWWLLLVLLVLLFVVFVIVRKIHAGRQLKRDIRAEFESIKQHYRETQNKLALARALSVLLRRASITYYPQQNIAGLTGEDWLAFLDATGAGKNAGGHRFQSDTGKVLLSAPYLPDDKTPDFDPQTLMALCESWLLASHKKSGGKPS